MRRDGTLIVAPPYARCVSEHFADTLAAAVERAGSPVCVGLDPVYEKLPGELRCGTPDGAGAVGAIARFCEGVIDSVAGVVPAVKLQSACFERYGGAGVELLASLVEQVRERRMVAILDAKRGDIGVSAEHYAAAAFGSDPERGADAVTLSGYMGSDTIEPFLAQPSRGVFVLVRTSNPGSDSIQSQRLADSRTVAELVADEVAALGRKHVGACGLSNVGAVVGATKPEDGARLRARMPDQVFLVPGYGAQGGTAADIRGMLRPETVRAAPSTVGCAARAGVLVTASRSIIYPGGPGERDWRGAIGAAAKKLATEIAKVVGS